MNHSEQPVLERIGILRRMFRTRLRSLRGPIEAVPLVNVVLLFLVFFMVQSPFVLQPGIIVNLPTSSFAAGAQYGALVVTISQEGLMFFNDELTSIEGLDAAFTQAALDSPDAPLVIEADGRVPHSTLVQVYNTAAAAGIKSVVLATRVSSGSGAMP